MTALAAHELQDLRDRAFAAMGEVERAKEAVEVGRKFAVALGPLTTSHAADDALGALRDRLAEQLMDALHEAQQASQAYCEATVGSWLGATVRASSTSQEKVTLQVAAVLWGNWRLGEDSPTFYLLEDSQTRHVPDSTTPCLGAAVWTIEQLG